MVSQRLNTENLIYAYLVGLIEANGWFNIIKKGKYLLYEFSLELNIKDIQLLYKIKTLLGVGNITIFYNNNKVKYSIRNKKYLINIIIPILDKYPMLSYKQYSYLNFKENLLNNIIYSKDIIPLSIIHTNFNENHILNQSYFLPFLIGYIELKGSFYIYSEKKNLRAKLEIKETNDKILIEAIKKYCKFKSKIYKNEMNEYKLKVSNIKDISNIINIIQKAPVKLLGYKKLKYLLWLKKLRIINNNIKYVPNKY